MKYVCPATFPPLDAALAPGATITLTHSGHPKFPAWAVLRSEHWGTIRCRGKSATDALFALAKRLSRRSLVGASNCQRFAGYSSTSHL
jgi:hypothetical protein